jgi:hypothetical protein
MSFKFRVRDSVFGVQNRSSSSRSFSIRLMPFTFRRSAFPKTPNSPGPEFATNRDHDLLSNTKIANIQYARKDAETTNSSSVGA